MKEPLSVPPPFLLSLLQACTHPEMVDGGQYRKGEGRAEEAHPTAEPVGWSPQLAQGSEAQAQGQGSPLGSEACGSMPSRFPWENAVEVSHPEEPWGK